MSALEILVDALEVVLDTPACGKRSAGTWAAAEAKGRAALLAATSTVPGVTLDDTVAFGHYWEVVHKATGEVVNSGFQRHAPGDKVPRAEVADKVSGFVVRSTALFTETKPAAKAA